MTNRLLQQQYEDELALAKKTKQVPTSKASQLSGLTNYNLGINKQTAQNSIAQPKKVATPTTRTTYTPPDLSGYNRAWGQNEAQFNLQSNQLDQSYQLALGQLGEQEKEEEGQTNRLAQQAYIARKQAERVLPNQLGMMGAANTGYENIATQNIQQQYESQYDQFMNNLAMAKAAIKRSRDSQNLNYAQNKESINLNKSQAYSDYQYQIQQANKNAYSDVSNDSAKNTKVTFDTVIQNSLKYGTPDRAWSYIEKEYKSGNISKEQAERLYLEFGQYWAYYNQ